MWPAAFRSAQLLLRTMKAIYSNVLNTFPNQTFTLPFAKPHSTRYKCMTHYRYEYQGTCYFSMQISTILFTSKVNYRSGLPRDNVAGVAEKLQPNKKFTSMLVH